MVVQENGTIHNQTKKEYNEEHCIISTFYFKVCPIIGIGYWRDTYKSPYVGQNHNIILPFCRIQWGCFGLDRL